VNYLFISDLHLGSPLFKLGNYLKTVFSSFEFDKVFVVGDLIDTWEDSIKHIVSKNRNLINVINNNKSELIIVRGNHDPSLLELHKIFPHAKVVPFYEDDELIAIHGHQFDYMILKYSALAKVLFPIHWTFERLGFDIQIFFRKLYSSIKDKHDKPYIKEIFRKGYEHCVLQGEILIQTYPVFENIV